MPIPDFEPSGLLPLGLYDCSFEELKNRFGSFEQTDRRPLLFAKLEAFILAARGSGFERALVVNGSFVTSKPSPNDIDLIIVVAAEHDLRADLSPSAYNVVSKKRVQKRFGFDIVAVREGTAELDDAIAFFQQVRGEPNLHKALLRLRL